MEISDVVDGIFEWGVSQSPSHAGNRSFALIYKLKTSAPEKRHGEIARQVHTLGIKTNVHWEGLDEIFPIVAIIKSSRPKKRAQSGRLSRGHAFRPR